MQARETWTSQKAFLWASIGAAVGLGNLWRFPFMTGQNGGAAFVLVYLICVLVLAIPIALLEISLGRIGQHGAIVTIRQLRPKTKGGSIWMAIGWLSVAIPFIGLSYYSLVAGWSMEFVFRSGIGAVNTPNAESSAAAFDLLKQSPGHLLFLNALFIGSVAFVVSRGVQKGIETASTWLMPLLFALLIMMVAYAVVAADIKGGLSFLFAPDFSKITPKVIFLALGQAFFSIAVGVGALITYGAYLPSKYSLPKSAVIIALADTLAAILAGMAIFPIVFQYGLDPADGPGLIFVTLPIAFTNMPAGQIVGTLFFALLFFAAFSSAIAMLEPVVSCLVDRGYNRAKLAAYTGLTIWLLGIPATLSFSYWSEVHPIQFVDMLKDKSLFDLYDFLVANLMIPLNGLLIALFGGWVIAKQLLRDEIRLKSEFMFKAWHLIVRYLAPIVIFSILVSSLTP